MTCDEVAQLTKIDPVVYRISWKRCSTSISALRELPLAKCSPRIAARIQALRRQRRRNRQALEREEPPASGARRAANSAFSPSSSASILARPNSRSFTPYLYSTYEEEDESVAVDRPQEVIILGSGPNRIGQGIEFDYCCCHAAFALQEDGYETIMVNCNPETVSTDYDTSDRLYFEPLTLEDVLAVYRHEARRRAEA